MIDLTVKEIYTIVGILMLLLAVFTYPRAKKIIVVFSISGAYLVLNYFLPKNLFFDIISFVVLITPFVYFKVNKKSFLE